MDIKDNVASLMSSVPSSVVLVGAAKTKTAAEIEASIDGGLKVIGMNYLQEAMELKPQVTREVLWSFIGRIQSNKVKKLVEYFHRLETIDSVSLAQKVGNEALAQGKVMEVMFSVNIGGEESKSGLPPMEVVSVVKSCLDVKGIDIVGVMTMGSVGLDEAGSRAEFRQMKSLYDELFVLLKESKHHFRYLSMGMSDSFRFAIEEGSNYIRLGTAIYGKRDYPAK